MLMLQLADSFHGKTKPIYTELTAMTSWFNSPSQNMKNLFWPIQSEKEHFF